MKKVGSSTKSSLALSKATAVLGAAQAQAGSTTLRAAGLAVAHASASEATHQISSESVPAEFPFRLSLYTRPPTFSVTVDEFEEWALARLALLRALDDAIIRGQRDDDLRIIVKRMEAKHKTAMHSNSVAKSYPLEVERKRDLVGHYVMQLLFAGSSEGRRWLVSMEGTLLRLRWLAEVGAEKMQWLESELVGYRVLPEREKQDMRELLAASSPHVSVDSEDFYEMPFHHVPDLVGRRTVYLWRGVAYVPKSDAFSAVLTRFRKQLEEYMQKTAEVLPALHDNRITRLLEAISSANMSDELSPAGTSGNRIVAAEVDKYAAHFPPCMQQLHGRLRSDHHLKYGGRQQYGIFLKAINLTLEEALAFWRRAFAAKIGDDAFAKNYAYNVRHIYGQEGKRVAAPPQSCMKIIGTIVSGGEEGHGCPFRHLRESSVERLLLDYAAPGGVRLNEHQVAELMEMVRGKHFQLTCTRLFELTRLHGQKTDTVTHPHVFFEASLAAQRQAESEDEQRHEEEELF